MRITRRSSLWCLTLGLFLACGAYFGYLAHLTKNGYCHAVGKYLTGDEKIRLALVDLLKRYPPSVLRSQLDQNGGYTLSAPEKPIFYRDAEDFLSLNPDCCKVRSVTYPDDAKSIDSRLVDDSLSVDLIETLMGTATRVVEVNYLVRYKNDNDLEQSIKAIGYLHITNCGTPGKPWSPY